MAMLGDRRLSLGVLAVGAAAVVTFLVAPPDSAWQVGAFFVPLLLSFALVAARLSISHSNRGLLALLLGAQGLYVALSLVWYLRPVVFDRALPFPSPLDAGYFLAYSAFALFLTLVLRRRSRDKDMESRVALTDALILTTALSAALWVGVIEPNLDNASSTASTAVAVAYPAFTLLMFGLGARLAVSSTFGRSACGVLLLLWIGAEVAGDTLYGVQGVNGTFEYASPLTVTWIVSYTALAALAAHPGIGELLGGDGDVRRDAAVALESAPRPRHRTLRLVILLLASLVPLALIALEGGTSLVLLATSAVTFTLVTYRSSLLAGDLREQRKLATELDEAVEELRRTNTDLQRATQAKSTFLATMSHEIRTPMNAIIGMTGLLRETPLNAEQQEYVESVRNAGDNLLAIINDILDFSKIEAGQMELEEQPFDLIQCVESAVDLVATQATAKALELLYLINSDCPKAVRGDVTRLRQIMANLLSNAVKFTAEGEVVLGVRRDPASDEYLVFHVTDTGIGIPDDRRDRLFQTFSQVDASTTRSFGGTGLGLAVSRRLAEAMGGRMWVESSLGRGSTFSFTCRLPAHTKSLPSTVRLPASQMANRRVLVVDDNETNRRILDYQLNSWGMVCDEADSADEALALLRDGRCYDAAILDMHMPGTDGEALAVALRQQPSGRSLPLIMLTSLGHRQRRVGGADFHAVLTKPVRPSGLFDALAEALVTLRDEDLPTASQEDSAEATPARQLRILVAEDNPVNQKVALRILERLGHRADVASNGEEAVESVRRQPYDVVLMDVQMPEMDGLDATRYIRAELPSERQPHIIAMTANAFSEDRAQCLEAGMDDYLSKPVRKEQLAGALANAAQQTTAQDRSAPDGSSALEVGHV
jgi:signal transduction histidine kinase/DNA-binding response OmpR family regulator